MQLERLNLYFALLSALLHVGRDALAALHAGESSDHPSLQKLDTHLTAITGVVDALGANVPVLAQVAADVKAGATVTTTTVTHQGV